MNTLKLFPALTLSILLTSCNTKKGETGIADIQSMNKEDDTPGIVLSYMDTTVRPQDNFFQFVNGNWITTNTIPDDRGYWGVGPELAKNAQTDMFKALDKAIQENSYKKGSDQYKALIIYQGVLDTVSRNKVGFTPLTPYLKKIEEINSVKEINQLLVEWRPLSIPIFYGYGPMPDLKNSTMNVVYLGTGTTGLPERAYYVLEDQESKTIREKYIAHITRVFQMLEIPEASKKAQNVLEVETKIASLKMPKEDLRDPRNTYNPMRVETIEEVAGSIDWVTYFSDADLSPSDTVIVSQPKYLKGLDELLSDTPLEQLKDYMQWTMIDRTANYLTTDLEKLNWEFYSKTLNGALKQKPIKERALSVVNGSLGEAVGQIYVDEKFPPEAKEKAQRLVENLLAAYRVRIKNLDWMSEETKLKAIEKLDKLTVKIGYPNEWKDYSEMKILTPAEGGSYFSNLLNITKWNYNESLKKIGNPVDKTEWYMTPQTVNAYFFPPNNEIVFPAAILQPPYFNYKADMAVNYGGIGSIIGHEISHAFDDSGSRFDADGNLNNWWSEEDSKAFIAKGKSLVTQYNELEPLPGVFVNGEYTLGENIGDLGGVNAAFDALQIDMDKNGNPGLIDGFTQEERFFIAWAASWRSLIREETLKNAIKTDPHSPAQYRGYMPLRNMNEFHEIFKIKPGDSMYLPEEKRVRIW